MLTRPKLRQPRWQQPDWPVLGCFVPTRRRPRVFFRLLLLFTLIPLVELALLIWVAEHTSLIFTLWLVVLTGVVGAWLARREGLRCLWNVQRQVAQGELPAAALLEGFMVLAAGLLLITPGILTDVFGFGLLVPPIRRLVRRALVRRIEARVVSSTQAGKREPSRSHDEIIDVRVIDVESHNARSDKDES